MAKPPLPPHVGALPEERTGMKSAVFGSLRQDIGFGWRMALGVHAHLFLADAYLGASRWRGSSICSLL